MVFPPDDSSDDKILEVLEDGFMVIYTIVYVCVVDVQNRGVYGVYFYFYFYWHMRAIPQNFKTLMNSIVVEFDELYGLVVLVMFSPPTRFVISQVVL